MILLILGFLLDKKVGVNQPKRKENAKILIANTPMDTDKIKVWKARFQFTNFATMLRMTISLCAKDK